MAQDQEESGADDMSLRSLSVEGRDSQAGPIAGGLRRRAKRRGFGKVIVFTPVLCGGPSR